MDWCLSLIMVLWREYHIRIWKPQVLDHVWGESARTISRFGDVTIQSLLELIVQPTSTSLNLHVVGWSRHEAYMRHCLSLRDLRLFLPLNSDDFMFSGYHGLRWKRYYLLGLFSRQHGKQPTIAISPRVLITKVWSCHIWLWHSIDILAISPGQILEQTLVQGLRPVPATGIITRKLCWKVSLKAILQFKLPVYRGSIRLVFDLPRKRGEMYLNTFVPYISLAHSDLTSRLTNVSQYTSSLMKSNDSFYLYSISAM